MSWIDISLECLYLHDSHIDSAYNHQNKERKKISHTANLVGNHIHSPNIFTEIQTKVTI